MARLYLYSFENNLPITNVERLNPVTGLPFEVLYIYAESEAEARRVFKSSFEIESGKLLGRSRW